MRFLATLLFVAAVFASQTQAQSIGANLSGTALRQHLRTNYSPTAILSYREARKHMFETIDDLNGDNQLMGVYTGTTFHAHSIPNHNFVNCEHSWPQSKFSGSGMKSDIHHLYPTFNRINAERGNKPFGDIADSSTDEWCGPGNSLSQSMPASGIDEFSESTDSLFEPRESHKGNVARSMMYFAVIYEFRNGKPGWQQWFSAQLPTLRAWHIADPVDQAERDRTTAIAGVQGNTNPFILDPSLASRVFGGPPSPPSAGGNGPTPSPQPGDSNGASAVSQILALLPNPPGQDEGNERVILSNPGTNDLTLSGWKLQDDAGNVKLLDGLTISAQDVIVIKLEAGEMPLSNSGDTIELIDGNGNVMDRATYTKAEAQSHVFITFPE